MQPAANLVRYNVQASPLQQRGVPVVVPHLQEPIMGSRTKEGQYLHKCKLPVSTVQHSAKKRESGKTNYLPRCNASSSMVLLIVVLQQVW